MRPEPQLEELSAYLDQELTGLARQELDVHLQSCETCRRRLESLRQTVGAIQALPTEAPPRVFTIPAQREQPRRRFAPVFAWVGGATAAALVAIVVGIQMSHGLGSGSPATTAAQANAPAYLSIQPSGRTADKNTQQGSAALAAPIAHGNQQTVSDPRNSAYALTLATQAGPVDSTGALLVSVTVQGVPAGTNPTVHLWLVRNGYAFPLPESLANGESFNLGRVAMAEPRAGKYSLEAVWDLPGGGGDQLIASVPIELR